MAHTRQQMQTRTHAAHAQQQWRRGAHASSLRLRRPRPWPARAAPPRCTPRRPRRPWRCRSSASSTARTQGCPAAAP
jgi:hypothetical protein